MGEGVYEVYTDGACANNQGAGGQPGGWAAVFVGGSSLSGGDPATTNNRMEMQAVIEALKHVPEQSTIKIYSDSAYVINCFQQKWIDNWERNGWMTSQKKPVENQDLWKEMRSLQKSRNVQWVKVKGHSGNPWNEKADQLAVASIPGGIKKTEDPKMPIQISLQKEEWEEVLQILKASPVKKTMVDHIASQIKNHP